MGQDREGVGTTREPPTARGWGCSVSILRGCADSASARIDHPAHEQRSAVRRRSWMAKRNGRSTTNGTGGSGIPPARCMTTAVAAAASVPSSSTATKASCSTSLILRARRGQPGEVGVVGEHRRHAQGGQQLAEPRTGADREPGQPQLQPRVRRHVQHRGPVPVGDQRLDVGQPPGSGSTTVIASVPPTYGSRAERQPSPAPTWAPTWPSIVGTCTTVPSARWKSASAVDASLEGVRPRSLEVERVDQHQQRLVVEHALRHDLGDPLVGLLRTSSR